MAISGPCAQAFLESWYEYAISRCVNSCQRRRCRWAGLRRIRSGGIWIGPRTKNGTLVLFRDGVQKEFPTGSAADLGTNHLIAQADGSVLASFDDGLVGLRQGKAQRMTTKNGLPCNAVYSFIEDKQKTLVASHGVRRRRASRFRATAVVGQPRSRGATKALRRPGRSAAGAIRNQISRCVS